jgi:peroxiredoxin
MGRFFVAALLALGLVFQGPSAQAELAKVGKPAPRLGLRDLEGRVFALSDLAYAGPERPRRPRTAVLLDFFRTDCPPCVKKLPELVRQHDRLRSQGIRVVLVALLEPDEGEQKLRAFLKANPVPFTVVVDRYEDVAKRYIYNGNSAVLPSMVVVDSRGIVQAVGRDLGGAVAEALARVGLPVSANESLPADVRIARDQPGR